MGLTSIDRESKHCGGERSHYWNTKVMNEQEAKCCDECVRTTIRDMKFETRALLREL